MNIESIRIGPVAAFPGRADRHAVADYRTAKNNLALGVNKFSFWSDNSLPFAEKKKLLALIDQTRHTCA